MWFIPTSNLPRQIAENVGAKPLKLCMFCSYLGSSFNLVKKLIATLFYCLVDIRRLNKIMLMH